MLSHKPTKLHYDNIYILLTYDDYHNIFNSTFDNNNLYIILTSDALSKGWHNMISSDIIREINISKTNKLRYVINKNGITEKTITSFIPLLVKYLETVKRELPYWSVTSEQNPTLNVTIITDNDYGWFLRLCLEEKIIKNNLQHIIFKNVNQITNNPLFMYLKN